MRAEIEHSTGPNAVSPSPGVAFVEGAFVPIADARIPILDFGFLRSDATYDVVGVWGGRFFRLDAHLERFRRGVAKLRFDLPYDSNAVASILAECVRRAGLDAAYAAVIATRGLMQPGSRDIRLASNRLYAFAIPYLFIATPEQRQRGLRLAVGSLSRIPPQSVDPRIKNYHWLDLELALLDAYDRSHDSVVLTDGRGLLTEGAGFNLFVVHDGRVRTPAVGVLEGVTRRTVIDIGAEIGIPVEAGAVPVEALLTADEAFIATTAGGIMPVTVVEARQIGDGNIGPVTQRIYNTYWAWHDDPRHTVAVADVPPLSGPT